MSSGTTEVADDSTAAFNTGKDWTKRLHAYTDWLNVQLKKHPKSRKVTDLRSDLQDGVVIAQLVEALGGERVVGIEPNPSSPSSRKENIEKVFEHFSSRRIQISNCRAKDVLAGDPKSIMRLIHAVASHYRPESVLNPPAVTTNVPSPSRFGKPSNLSATNNNSSSDVAGHNHHARCSSLPYSPNKEVSANQKLAPSSSSSSMGRPRPPVSQHIVGKKPTTVVGGVSSSSSSSALPIRKPTAPTRELASKTPSTTTSLSIDNKRSPLRKSFTSLTAERLHKKALLSSGTVNNSIVTKEAPAKISCKVAPLQYSAKTITTTGSDIPELHSLPSLSKLTRKKSLVSRSEPCSLDSVDVKTVDGFEEKTREPKTCSCSTLSEEEIVELLKDIHDAKNQLLTLQDLLLHGNGGKFMKNSDLDVPYGISEDVDHKIPTHQVLHDSSTGEPMNNNRRSRPSEPISMVCGERKPLEVDDHRTKIGIEPPDLRNRNIKEENDALRKTIQEKELEIRRLKVALGRVGSIDKKMKYPYSVSSQTQREELQVVHEALTSLRKCFPANDPYQHTLDTIEQSLSALLERVNSLEIGVVPPQKPPTVTDVAPVLPRRTNYDSLNDGLRRPLPKTSGFTATRHDETRCATKVVYYMDKSVTPFRCVLHKRIGEATLRDFKLLFDRPGQYRYHFKTLDPEFGMVKEEVLHDDDVLPGWDGKIIAWIEEDCS